MTKVALINELEKDHSMIETCHLKNVIFIQRIVSFVLSRKIINIYNNIAHKYGNVTFKNFLLKITQLSLRQI